jgi:hypothetical protein
VVPTGGRVVPDEAVPGGTVRRESAGEAGELRHGLGVLARREEEVFDLEEITGDLEVAVAVHGVRGPSVRNLSELVQKIVREKVIEAFDSASH